MIRVMSNSSEMAATVASDDREYPGAHTQTAIARVVIGELERVLPATARRPLTAQTSLSACGIDDVLLGDAVARIEGRYGMRFRAEWLALVRNCGDLVDCVAERMFDAADRTAGQAAEALPSRSRLVEQRTAPAPATGGVFPECAALEQRLADLQAAGLENPFRLATESVRGRTASSAGPTLRLSRA